jgi:DNA polymerase-3 subunit alpha
MLLNTHSYFSLRYGLLSPVELLQQLSQDGWQAAALTDINSSSAAMDFVRLSAKYGIRPVLGIDFRNGVEQKYVGIARSNEGFHVLNQHLSAHLHAGIPFDQAPVDRDVFVIHPLHSLPADASVLSNENAFIGISLRDLGALRMERIDWPKERMVLLHSCSFRHKKDHNTHRLLRAIERNCLLSKLPKEECAPASDRFISQDELCTQLSEFPWLIDQTRSLLERCGVCFEFGRADRNHNLKSYTGNEALDYRLMKHICYGNLRYRYPDADKQVLSRLQKELEIIRQKKFVSYFLINWCIVKYARSRGYFYVGRGSGANSIVAYLMRITDVDPVELDLYFERFINLYRANPPDFDIDFSWTDRDDIIRFIFDRFPHVSLLGAYVTFQYRAVVRELGKVFGLPKREIDRLAAGNVDVAQLDDTAQLVFRYGKRIQDMPNYLSIHAGGILITDRPIHCFTATFLPPKGFPTAQFDMVVAEDVSIYKFDILSQRGLGKIRDALQLIRENQPEQELPDIHDIRPFKEDPKIREMLREGRAIGCFYVESPAMRVLMRKLQVDEYLGLVAASSVIRPGVARSGMMREYILRYRFPERREDAHPVMRDIMPDTFGVMVYQEDVIKVAHYFAGLSLAEADVLRRGMSGKFRGREEFERARMRFFERCRQKGYAEQLTSEVWRQVESFAGYAFAKGHSASYAVESYQSLYLKAHFPLEYMVATVNNGGGFYSVELYLHEARMLGAAIEAPCVNQSGELCSIQGSVIRLGLGMIKGLECDLLVRLLEERAAQGCYASVQDLVRRVPCSLEQMRLLVRIGALRFTGKNKKELMWEVHLLLGVPLKPFRPKTLFDPPLRPFRLPELDREAREDAYDQIELLGFPLCDFFLLYETEGEGFASSDLKSFIGKEVWVWGYLVTAKQTRTAQGKPMMFGNFLDRDGLFIDTVHFPEAAGKWPFRGKGIYRIHGKVIEEFGCCSIDVQSMKKAPMHPDPRYADIKRKLPAKKIEWA